MALWAGRCLEVGVPADKYEPIRSLGATWEAVFVFTLICIVTADVLLGVVWYKVALGYESEKTQHSAIGPLRGTEIRTRSLVPKDGLPGCLRDVDQSHKYQVLESDVSIVWFGLCEWTSETG